MTPTATRASVIAAVVSLLIPFSFAYATDCGALPGTREATANDEVVKNGQIAAGTCYNPSDPHIGTSAQEPKAYLKSLQRTGSATDDGNIAKLSAAFAQCSAKFLKDYAQRYGQVTIRSAYRSPEYDAKMCVNNPQCGALANNPNPMGNHQRGLAMDIAANNGNQQSLWDFARNNPQYGVCFPFTGEGGGFKDTVHMILAGGPGSEGSGPGCRGVTKPCDGSNFDPKDVPSGSSGPVAGNSPVGGSAPTGGTNNPFANSYNPTQQSIPSVPQPSYPSQQASTGPVGGSGNTVSPTPTTGSYTASYETSYGAGGNPNTVQGTTGASTSSAQLIASLGNSTQSGTTGTSVKSSSSTVLNNDLRDVANIDIQNSGNTNVSDIAYRQVVSSTSVQVPQAEVQNTFSDSQQNFSAQQNAQAQQAQQAQQTADAQNSVMIALIGALRSLLQTFSLMLQNGTSAGFKGSWQLPAAPQSFEY